jgi:hypothetical protein
MGADMGVDMAAAMNDGMLERIAPDWNRDAVSIGRVNASFFNKIDGVTGC